MTERIDWKAAFLAGLIAGAVFMMLEMVLVATVGGGSPWGPPRMIAAIIMGREVLPPPATFELVPMMVAMMVHLLLSILLGIILGWAISHWRFGLTISVIVGTVFGLIIYVVNFYGFSSIWPWFAMARGWISIFAHAMFGLVLGWAYYAIATPPEKVAP